VRRGDGELLEEGEAEGRVGWVVGVAVVVGRRWGGRRGVHGHEEERVEALRDGEAVVGAVCVTGRWLRGWVGGWVERVSV
jgi:hypothetical protein